MVTESDLVKALQRLEERTGIRIERAILFGSRARGEAGPHSDVDLMLVSSSFEGKTLSQRAAPLHLAWDLDVPVDFVCYAPSEFERLRRRVSLVRVALEEGVEVAA